jgi:N-acetylglutamate synthase-like GNAT family acetyltransferase
MTFSDRAITKEEIDEIYADFVKIENRDGVPPNNQRRFEFVAEDNGMMVGLASGLTNHKWFFLSDIWVREGYRGSGLGSELLVKLEEKVKLIGIEQIYTWTPAFGESKFFKKHGYEVFTVFEDYYEIKGCHHIGYTKDIKERTDT